MATDPEVPAAPDDLFDAPKLARRWGRHPVSISRYVAQGLLAAPRYLLGRKVWTLAQVLEAEGRMLQVRGTRTAALRAQGAQLAAAGRAAKVARAAGGEGSP